MAWYYAKATSDAIANKEYGNFTERSAKNHPTLCPKDRQISWKESPQRSRDSQCYGGD